MKTETRDKDTWEYYEILRKDAERIPYSSIENAYHRMMTPLVMFLNKQVTGKYEILGFGKRRKQIVIGKENLPDAPCLFCLNHTNASDISSAYNGIKRQFYVLADANQLNEPATKFFNDSIGAVYVKRSFGEDELAGIESGTYSIPEELTGRHAKLFMINRLMHGQNCLMFIEGTWNMSHNELVLPCKYGCIDIAIAAKVPIVPVCLEYLYEKNMEIISIEKPLYFDESTDKKEAIEDVRSAIASRKWEIMLEHAKANYSDVNRNTFEEIIIKNLFGYIVFPPLEEMSVIYTYDEFDAWKRRAQYDRLYWVHQEACRRYYQMKGNNHK